jgi:hypothetical protein
MMVKISAVIGNQTAIAFLQKQSGSMHVKQELQDIDTARLIRLPGIFKIQEGKPMTC